MQGKGPRGVSTLKLSAAVLLFILAAPTLCQQVLPPGTEKDCKEYCAKAGKNSGMVPCSATSNATDCESKCMTTPDCQCDNSTGAYSLDCKFLNGADYEDKRECTTICGPVLQGNDPYLKCDNKGNRNCMQACKRNTACECLQNFGTKEFKMYCGIEEDKCKKFCVDNQKNSLVPCKNLASPKNTECQDLCSYDKCLCDRKGSAPALDCGYFNDGPSYSDSSKCVEACGEIATPTSCDSGKKVPIETGSSQLQPFSFRCLRECKQNTACFCRQSGQEKIPRLTCPHKNATKVDCILFCQKAELMKPELCSALNKTLKQECQDLCARDGNDRCGCGKDKKKYKLQCPYSEAPERGGLTGAIVMLVVLPFVLILLILFVFVLFWFERRALKEQVNPKQD